MNPRRASVLAIAIGALAGLRPMTVSAVLARSAKRKWVDFGRSPFANIISAGASGRLTELAVSELIRDKLPFTPSRLNIGSLASRITSGAICGATVFGALRRPLGKGALLGGLGAMVGTLGGHYTRQNLPPRMPDFGAGLLEDGFALGGSALIVAQIAQRNGM
jgi:uncharacterized membrane protein